MIPNGKFFKGSAADQRAHIESLRAHRQPVSQFQLDELAAQEAREAENNLIKAQNELQRAQKKAAEEKAFVDHQEAARKAETKAAYLDNGGTPEAFELVYPELREKRIERETLDALAARRAGGAPWQAGAF